MFDEKLAEEHWGFALRYLWKRHGHQTPMLRDRLYDATVDAFLAALRRWDGRGTFRGYFVYRVHWLWGKVLKASGGRGPDPVDRLPDPASSRAADRVDVDDFLSEKSRMLPGRQRDAVRLHLRGDTRREIAATLSVSDETVRLDMAEAVRYFKESYERA